MTIAEILTLPSFLLRDHAAYLWQEKMDGKLNALHLGATLSRIKEERYFSAWGHRKFSHFCREELRMSPVFTENLYISAFRQAYIMTQDEAELTRMESVGIRNIVRTLKIAKTLEDFWRYARNPPTNLERRRLHDRQITIKISKERLDMVESFMAYLRAELQLSKGQSLVLLTLMAKARLDTSPQTYRDKLSKLCLEFHIPMRVVDFFAPY